MDEQAPCGPFQGTLLLSQFLSQVNGYKVAYMLFFRLFCRTANHRERPGLRSNRINADVWTRKRLALIGYVILQETQDSKIDLHQAKHQASFRDCARNRMNVVRCTIGIELDVEIIM